MYKTQIACAIIILYIGILYFRSGSKEKKSSKWFVAILICSFFQLVFDALSVYTVNHLEMVSPVTNRIIHIAFMGLSVAFGCVFDTGDPCERASSADSYC